MKIAANFPTNSFASGETIVLVLRRESHGKTLHQVVPLEIEEAMKREANKTTHFTKLAQSGESSWNSDGFLIRKCRMFFTAMHNREGRVQAATHQSKMEVVLQLSTAFAISSPTAAEFTVPKLYPSSGNRAFFALLASIRINKLRGINKAQ